jgi:hypothetical protein
MTEIRMVLLGFLGLIWLYLAARLVTRAIIRGIEMGESDKREGDTRDGEETGEV